MASTGKTEEDPFFRTFQFPAEEDPTYEEMTEEEKAHGSNHGNLQVQARVDLVVHGTERPDGPPATLMVFGFHFDGFKDKLLLEKATIEVEFQDKRNRPSTDPVVVSLWPQGKFSLGKDRDAFIGYSTLEEMEFYRYPAISEPDGVWDNWSNVVLQIFGHTTAIPDYQFAVLLRRPGMESKSDDELLEATFSINCDIEFPPNRINRRMIPFRTASDKDQIAFQPGQNYIRRSSSSEVLGGSMIKKFIDTNNLSAVKLDDLVGDAAKSMLATYEVRTKRLVLSPEITSWLESKNLLDPVIRNRRALSMAVFRDTDFTWTQESSSNEPAAFISNDGHPQVDIPVHLYSTETYEFLGYTRGVAENLWQRVERNWKY